MVDIIVRILCIRIVLYKRLCNWYDTTDLIKVLYKGSHHSKDVMYQEFTV